jgi:hypothetical protein
MGGTDDGGTVVWARRAVALATCPKSYLTAESEALLEHFWVAKRAGSARVEEWGARQAEAFLILDGALAEEKRHGRAQRHF